MASFWRTAIVILSFFLWPENPLIPFVVAVVTLTILLSISKGESEEWMAESWGFAKQILPLFAAGVLLAGFLLGTPGWWKRHYPQ